MTSKEERVCMDLLKKAGKTRPHVRRLGPSVSPLIWQISQLPKVRWSKRYTRQIKFHYRDRRFIGRYRHDCGGRLEIATQNGEHVISIHNIEEAMTVKLRSELDCFIETARALPKAGHVCGDECRSYGCTERRRS